MIGGSYAEKLSALGFEVGALARRQEPLDFALQRGMIAHGQTEVTRDYVSQFDLVVSALYPKAFVEWIRRYQDFLKQGAVITDVSGVKRAVVPVVQGMLRDDLEFVPAHPMAIRVPPSPWTRSKYGNTIWVALPLEETNSTVVSLSSV